MAKSFNSDVDSIETAKRREDMVIKNDEENISPSLSPSHSPLKKEIHFASDVHNEKEHDNNMTPFNLDRSLFSAYRIGEGFHRFHFKFVQHSRLASWMKDNPFLEKHHRPQLNSVWLCILSMFYLHTETINIWTHFLGCVMYLTIILCYIFDTTASLSYIDKFMFIFFFVGAFTCLTCSWTFHTFICHSKAAYLSFSKLDYCGIAILCLGSFIPWIYYVFYCRIVEKLFYIIFITTLSIPVFVVSFFDKFATPEYRTLRAMTFLGLGLSTFVPIFHAIILYGPSEAVERAGLVELFTMAAFYISGAIIYASRVPERFFPGRCDLFIHSHQIFHVFAVVGTFVHHHDLKELFYLSITKYDCSIASTCIND